MKKTIAISILSLSLFGCNTELAHLRSLGKTATIMCYSGGVKIYDGQSDGKVMNATNSDGYEFMDAKTHHLVQVSGTCVIDYSN